MADLPTILVPQPIKSKNLDLCSRLQSPHSLRPAVRRTFAGVAGIHNRFRYLDEMRAALASWASRLAALTKTADAAAASASPAPQGGTARGSLKPSGMDGRAAGRHRRKIPIAAITCSLILNAGRAADHVWNRMDCVGAAALTDVVGG